jgi:hypothetical protein
MIGALVLAIDEESLAVGRYHVVIPAEHDVASNVGLKQRVRHRVQVPTAGMLHLHLTWTEAKAELGVWVAGQHLVPAIDAGGVLDATIPVNGGEVIVYALQVGSQSYRVPFTLATSLTQ